MSPHEEILGQALIRLAKNTISEALSGVAPEFLQVDTASAGREHECPELEQAGASFVTLTKQGELRGCIGSLEAHRTLRKDVQENAIAAAFLDPRFPAVSAAEWPEICIEVSLLSAPQNLPVRNEKDLREKLRPGIDGVIFRSGHRRATFLPQVWEQLPTPERFLSQLKQKAGFAADYWSADIEIAVYQVQKWREKSRNH
jgi:AmmeMemoRadiSam system protein A